MKQDDCFGCLWEEQCRGLGIDDVGCDDYSPVDQWEDDEEAYELDLRVRAEEYREFVEEQNR